jgi:peptidoglycan/LPS O-acetylase OafA/YrhL
MASLRHSFFYGAPMNPTTTTARNHGLDTLRALAIVLVFVYHYMVFVSGQNTFGFLSQVGWIGVDLFFALSGYLIGNQIFAAIRSGRPFSLKRFYARRLLRTLPNYYVVLALYFLWPWFRGESALLPLWKFVTFTQNWELRPGTAFSHAWSLCIEEQFYILLPAAALLFAAMRRSLLWVWIGIAASLVGSMCLRAYLWKHFVEGSPEGGLNYMRFIYYSSFCRFDELVAGVALALAKNYHPAAWQRITARGNLVLLLGAGVTSATVYMLLQDERGLGMTVFGFPLLALGFSLLIVAAVSGRSILRSTRVPGAGKLALWSYASYLTHKQVCILANGYLQPRGIGPDSLAGVAIMIALSLLAGWLLYRVVETPFMALRERFVPTNFAGQGAVQPSAVASR